MELRMEMKSWKLLASGVFVACSISASALDLAALDGNVPRYTIIGDNSKGMSPLYAARELRDYILKITGHEIGVTNSKGPGIVTKTILISIVDDPALGDDGFRIKAKKDGNVVIAGGKRGVIYGVYELLETHGGVGWFSSWCEVVPEKPSFNIPDDLDFTDRPAFLWRNPSWRDVCDHEVFAIRLRMNGDGNTWRFSEEHGGAYHYVRGLSTHCFNNFLPAEKYFGDHPEWFSEIGGQRRGRGRFTQICLTNDEALEESVKNIRELIDRDQGAGMISISPNDNYQYCECARCKKMTGSEGSVAGPLLNFVNRIAERLEPQYPRLLVRMMAYQGFREPPRTIRPRDNVFVEFCMYENEYAHPHLETTHPPSRDNVRAFDTWSKIRSRAGMGMWDYVSNWDNHLRPMAIVYSFKPNYEYYLDRGVKYLYSEGDRYHADFAELKAYLAAKLAWNPHQDDKRLIDRFFAGYYGAGAPYVREWMELVNAAFRPPRAWQRIFCHDQPQYLTPDILERGFGLFDRAAKAVEGDAVREYNVRMGRLPVLNTYLEREYKKLKLVWATECPEKFQGPDKRYAARLAEFERLEREALAKRNKFRIGSSNYGVSVWKDALLFRRPESGQTSAIAGTDVIVPRYSNLGGIVDEPSAAGGRTLRIRTDAMETAATFHCSKLAYDSGSKYRLRIHARIGKVPGGRGEAFRVRVYDVDADAQRLLFAPQAENITDDWAWFDVGSFYPSEGALVQFASGRFENGGGVGVAKFVDIDQLEFIKEK